MSGAPTFDTGKKQKRGEFITPPRPTGRRSNKSIAERINRCVMTEIGESVRILKKSFKEKTSV